MADDNPKQDAEVSYNLAMRRVVYLVLIGCGVAIFYAFRFVSDGLANIFETWTNAMMAGGAALVSGGLLGFLFGVPHTREEGTGRSSEKEPGEESNEPDKLRRSTQTTYRPNTSLEQISDWLSKMLVGVGLVEIKVIPEKLKGVAAYVAKGLGDDESAKTFAMTELLYFSICGFVFGFLWARLYLPRWFRQADEGQIQELGEKIDRLAARQNADARALALIPYLNLETTEDSGVTEQEVANRIKAASPSTRSVLFAQAQRVSEDDETDNFDMVIWIFKGLIKSDTTNRYHRNHSELSYAFRRQKPPNWPEAEKAISDAIQIRNDLQVRGWRYYEFHRARCRIEQDPNFKKGVPSDTSVTDRILDDLREAYTDIDKWDKWNYEKSSVRKWMNLNHIETSTLQKGKAGSG
jgi:hypothetical protein